MATSPSEPEGPIVDIFKNLIKNDNPRKIVLTNSHLIEILQKEFYMDTALMQKFEVDIYIYVLKKYLKNWPQWDSLGTLKEEKDHERIIKTLKIKYVEIKEYLSSLLDIAQDLASDKVQEINLLQETNDVIMEVEGSVQQLRSLFYRCPLNGSIFNTKMSASSVQIPKRLTFESIVNWFGVEIKMTARANKKILEYKRLNRHKLAHRLINSKLKVQTPCQPELKTDILVKCKGSCVTVARNDLMKHIKKSLNSDANKKWRSVSGVFEMVIGDLNHLPEFIDISSDYRRHISKLKYVRYFTQELLESDDTDRYDLHLEEVVSPLCEYSFQVTDDVDDSLEVPFTLTCTYCQVHFIGKNCVSDVLRHFSTVHLVEPDWKCLKCSKSFAMCTLTKTAWNHDCV